MTELSADVKAQIDALDLSPTRPLIMSDADEVLLKFVERLEHYLDVNGMYYDIGSFALSGNIKHKHNDEVANVHMPDLLRDFFLTQSLHIDAVTGAAAALEALSARAQIVVLTNSEAEAKQQRIDNLRHHEMDYPVVINSGLKGPAAAYMVARISAPVFFLDDIPHNINSVVEHIPHCQAVHFVADPRLAKLIPPAEKAAVRLDNWDAAGDWLSQQLTDHGF